MTVKRTARQRRSIADQYKNKSNHASANPLTQNFYDHVAEIATPQGLKVLQCIGDGATDENIEEKTKYKMASIRALLNVLHKHGFINYTREKNLANGWFTYTWKFDTDRALRNFFTAKRNELDLLKQRHASEEGAMFYRCTKGCVRLHFDAATEASFRCPKCASKLAWFDNTKERAALAGRIQTIERILANQNNRI